MEPPQIAVETLGGDAAEAPREALDLAVATVDRLDVHGPAHPLAGGAVDALVKNAERRGGGAMAATGVGDEQGVRVELRQGAAEGRAATSAAIGIGTCSRDRPRDLPRDIAHTADSGGAHRSPARSLPERPRPPVGPTEPQQPCGTAPPSVHRFSKTSPETVPDPLFRSPWSMQVRTQCSTCTCEMRTEPNEKTVAKAGISFCNTTSGAVCESGGCR